MVLPCPSLLSAFITARGAPPPLALARRLRASLGPRALSERQGAAHRDGHGQEVVIDWPGQVIPGEFDRQIDTERAGCESAAAFGEDSIAVAQLTPDSPDASTDERVAAETPARR